MLTKTEKN